MKMYLKLFSILGLILTKSSTAAAEDYYGNNYPNPPVITKTKTTTTTCNIVNHYFTPFQPLVEKVIIILICVVTLISYENLFK